MAGVILKVIWFADSTCHFTDKHTPSFFAANQGRNVAASSAVVILKVIWFADSTCHLINKLSPVFRQKNGGAGGGAVWYCGTSTPIV